MGIEEASAYQAMVGFSHDFYSRSRVSQSDVSYSYSVESDEDDDEGKKVQRTSTLETAASTWISQSSSEGNDYCASIEEDVDDMAEREDELSKDQSVGKSCHFIKSILWKTCIPPASLLLHSHSPEEDVVLHSFQSLEEDVVFELSNKIMILKHDVQCKEQATEEMMKTVKYLQTKNEKYAQQLCQLSSTVDNLVSSKNESINRMTAMDIELVARKTVIDELTEGVHNRTKLLEEKSAEIAHLSEQLQLTKAERNMLKTEVQTLAASSKNQEKMSVLENELATKKGEIDEMRDDIEHKKNLLKEKSAKINDLTVRLQLFKTKNQALVASTKVLSEQLQLATTRNVELEAEVQALVANTKVLEQDILDKTKIIDAMSDEGGVEMSEEIYNKSTLLEEKKVKIATLSKKLRFAKSEINGLKMASKVLDTSNNDNAQHMAVLEDEVAVTTNLLINEISEDLKWSSTCDAIARQGGWKKWQEVNKARKSLG
jgi:chromosome segregation ATPase